MGRIIGRVVPVTPKKEAAAPKPEPKAKKAVKKSE